MHAETLRLHFQTLFQHEVLYISTLNAGSHCRVTDTAIKVFLFFGQKGSHKIVEILALLTTKLSSSKIYKVGMLFCIL